MNPVDRTSNIPYYVQVMETLRKEIREGTHKPMDPLPGEQELCRLLGVSRTVIRQALKELEIERLIVREKGKGTFIAEPKIAESLVQKLTGFYQDMEARGYTPVTQVLKMVVSPAEPTVAAYLDREPGTPVVEIDRLRFVHGEPIVHVVTYLVSDLCPGIVEEDLTRQSLYRVLEQKYGLVIERGRRTIEAVVANDREAELFQIRKGDPLILLNSVGYLKGRKPIEYYRALHRGDRTRFEVELVRMHEGGRLDLEDVPSSAGLVD